MKRGRLQIRLGTLVLIGLVLTSLGIAASGPIPNDDRIGGDDYPKETIEAINGNNRVYGFGRSGAGVNVAELYYKGDTEKVNRFLSALAKLDDPNKIDLAVTIEEGPGRGKQRNGDRTDFDYNWSLTLGSSYVYSFEGNTVNPAGRMSFAYVHVYVSGDIDLAKLEIPLAFPAHVGGRIASLVGKHNGRREEMLMKPSSADTRPTREEKPPGIYGGSFPTEREPTSSPAR